MNIFSNFGIAKRLYPASFVLILLNIEQLMSSAEMGLIAQAVR